MTYTIKPLKWQERGVHDYVSQTIFGEAVVQKKDGRRIVTFGGKTFSSDSWVEAVKWAENAYLARLLPALEELP